MASFTPVPPNQADNLVLHPVLPPAEFLPGLALAVAIGLLIGVERGWRMREEPPGGRVAGVRTFAIIGLLGGLIGLEMTAVLRNLGLLLGAGAVVSLLLGYVADVRRDNNVSATSTLAGIVTLFLGAVAATGHLALASVGAGITVGLLAFRDALHKAIDYTSDDDLKALIRLALVVFLILPLLPDAGMGPFGGINPRRLWTVVVIVGSISFAGYVLTRWLGGRRGTLLTALVGAMVSSTAVTIESARRIREGGRGLAEEAAISVASLMMLIRVLFLVAVIAPLVLSDVARLIAPALILSLTAAAALAWFSGDDAAAEPVAVKPPGLGLAFLFAALVGALSLTAGWAEATFGGGSGALVIAIGGMMDVDAAIAAIGALPPTEISPHAAALAIAAPVAFNTLLKLGLLVSIAGRKRSKWAAANLAVTAAVVVLTGIAVVA